MGLASGGVAGAFISILVIQDGTGSRTVTWNAAYEFAADTAPTLTTTANLGDLFVFRYNGAKWLETGRNLALVLSHNIMFALVESGSITKMLNGNRGIHIGDLKYPRAIYTLWTEAERNAIGIYTVEYDDSNKKDENGISIQNQSYAFADNKVTASYGSATAKAHADTNWTQQNR